MLAIFGRLLILHLRLGDLFLRPGGRTDRNYTADGSQTGPQHLTAGCFILMSCCHNSQLLVF